MARRSSSTGPIHYLSGRRGPYPLARKALSMRGRTQTCMCHYIVVIPFTHHLRKEWTNFLYAAWSPMGTYAATVHRQGVRLWGGPSWRPLQRFAHPLAKLVDFSPGEQYLVTWSSEPIVVPEGATQGPQYFSPDDEGNHIAVWDIKSGNLLRTFSTTHEGETPANTKERMRWPALKWSPDDKFVARLVPGEMISVHELPSMYLQGKKSLKIEGVVDFEWCPLGDKGREELENDGKLKKKPRENMLVYWTPEVSNQPARVTLMAFPSRTILRQKNLFNVTEVSPFLSLGQHRTIFTIFHSASSIGKIKETSCASRSIGIPKRKNLFSATWKSSECARKTTL